MPQMRKFPGANRNQEHRPGVTYMEEVTGTGANIEGLVYQESSKLHMAEIEFKLT